jgi:succinate dehydrogenase / fumarate reductase cytochrome b subunit
MSTAHAASASSSGSFLDRHYFLLRRLHSLSGIVPIGVFLIPHLTTNSSIVWGDQLGHSPYGPGTGGIYTFQHEVNFIHSLPALVLIEVGLIWLPLLFHAAFGIVFARTGRNNVSAYRYGGNWRYALQRATGYIALVFIFFHLSSLRWGWTYGGFFPTFSPTEAASTTAEHFQDGRLGVAMAAFYLVGVLAAVYHFANGLWSAAITWGLTVSRQAQMRWGRVCTAIGVGLGAMGIAAIWGFSTLNIDEAKIVEAQMQAGVKASEGIMTGDAVEPGN